MAAVFSPVFRPVFKPVFYNYDFDLSNLFAAGEVGVWYEPSDLTTVFSDTSGSTPSTVGGLVARINDKSGNNLHAIQATSAAQPRLARTPFGGRRNLLNQTEAFNGGSWIRSSCSVAPNSVAAPNGEMTADTLDFTAVGGLCRQITPTVSLSAQPATVSIWLKAGTATTINVALLRDGGTIVASTNVTLTSEWQRVTVSATLTSATATPRIRLTSLEIGTVYAWGAQLEFNAGATAYQSVVSSYDVTEAGVRDCYYLYFDGIDDFMSTSTVDFTSTDEMSIFCGLSKLSDAAAGAVVELSSSPTSALNTGTFSLLWPSSANAPLGRVNSASKGSLLTAVEYDGPDGPQTAVVSTQSKISTDKNVIRYGGMPVAQSAADQGTGSYGSYPMFIGSRGGGSFYFNGHMYSLIVRGKNSVDGITRRVENLIAAETGVSL